MAPSPAPAPAAAAAVAPGAKAAPAGTYTDIPISNVRRVGRHARTHTTGLHAHASLDQINHEHMQTYEHRQMHQKVRDTRHGYFDL